jgi:hypothetical protein
MSEDASIQAETIHLLCNVSVPLNWPRDAPRNPMIIHQKIKKSRKFAFCFREKWPVYVSFSLFDFPTFRVLWVFGLGPWEPTTFRLLEFSRLPGQRQNRKVRSTTPDPPSWGWSHPDKPAALMIQPETPFVLKLLWLSSRSANSQICAVCCALFLTRLPGTERKVKAGLDRQPPRSSGQAFLKELRDLCCCRRATAAPR